ncbi:MAG: lysine exporter LysO family protein [Thermoprotei archaeon]
MEFIYVYLLVLAVAIILGRIREFKWAGKVQPYVTGVLIFFMGMWAGNEIRSLSAVGQLFITSSEILVPSVGAGYLTASAFGDRSAEISGARAKRSKLPYAFAISAALGWMVGTFVLLPSPTEVISGLLTLLVLVIGLDMGPSVGLDSFKRDLTHSWIPFSALVGAVAGGLISSALFSLNVKFSVAASVGLGWYSLDGPLLSSYFGPNYGMVGFMVNFLREQMTFFVVPLLCDQKPGALLTLGGSTTMDDTLSLYASTLGDDYKEIALFNGLVLSMIIPFLLPFILSA